MIWGLCWAAILITSLSTSLCQHHLLPSQEKTVSIFIAEIHCFSNFYHHGNIGSCFSWKAMDIHM